MSDYERGPYTPPSETPLAFDPRRPVRGSGPVPVTLIVSGVVLAVLIGAVAFLYRGGFKSPSDTNAAVGAPLAQIKGPAPGDATNEAAPGLTIYKTDSTGSPIPSNAAPAFVPGPEAPLPRTATPKPVTPVNGQALKPATPQTVALAPPPPAVTQAPAPHVAPPPIPVKAAPKPTAGGAWVQIGAFSSTALAEKGWNDVARLKPGAMGGKGIQVENVDKDGHTMYRTFVTGFASHDAALAFCADLKAAGHACLVK